MIDAYLDLFGHCVLNEGLPCSWWRREESNSRMNTALLANFAWRYWSRERRTRFSYQARLDRPRPDIRVDRLERFGGGREPAEILRFVGSLDTSHLSSVPMVCANVVLCLSTVGEVADYASKYLSFAISAN